MTRSSAMLVGAALLSACAARRPPGPPPDHRTCLEGVVEAPEDGPARLVGGGGAGGPIGLQAALADVAAALDGRSVSLCGWSGMTGVAWSLPSDEIELMSVDGLEAHLGTIEPGIGGWHLRRTAGFPREVRLVGATVPAALTDERGGLVWIAGRRDGRDFAVLRWGVVRREPG